MTSKIREKLFDTGSMNVSKLTIIQRMMKEILPYEEH